MPIVQPLVLNRYIETTVYRNHNCRVKHSTTETVQRGDAVPILYNTPITKQM